MAGDSPQLVDRIPTVADRVSDVIWLDESTVGAALATSFGFTEWQVISLDSLEVADEARARLVRSFTAEECDTYRIDPCPTLDEIGAR